MSAPYLRALSRDDISQWLVHFTGWVNQGIGPVPPLEVVKSILRTGAVRASTRKEITKYSSGGAACFYDVPPALYPKIVQTNPNGRQHYGVIVAKSVVWWKGGRPAIYTERPDDTRWPAEERFRLIWTDLTRVPHPVDWMHEREWRCPGALTLDMPLGVAPFCWWWPCVQFVAEAQALFAEFHGISAVYTHESGGVIVRS